MQYINTAAGLICYTTYIQWDRESKVFNIWQIRRGMISVERWARETSEGNLEFNEWVGHGHMKGQEGEETAEGKAYNVQFPCSDQEYTLGIYITV